MKPGPWLPIALMVAWSAACGELARADADLHIAEEPVQGDKPGPPDQKGQPEKNKVPETFSEELAERLTQQIGDGLRQHNARRLLSAFDPDAMVGYANFQSQVEAMFQQYDFFRVHFRLTQITSQGEMGVVVADFELEEIPRSQDAQPVRKTGPVRFEIKRGNHGWKIVEVKPRSFFS